MVLSLRESTAAEYAHTTVDPYTLIFNVMKLTVPIFDGSDPGGWISQIERLFDFHQAPEEWRLRLVSYHMEGEAEDWLFWALANNQLRTWPDFQFRFQQYFGCSDFEVNQAQPEPLQETPFPEYELVFKRLIDETTARIEDLEAKRKRIPSQESSPIGEQVKICDVEFKVGNGSSSPNTSVHREDSEVKKAPSIALVPLSANTVCLSPTLDSLLEKIAAKFLVTSLELQVFDEMPKSIFWSAKEVALCLKEVNHIFMEEMGIKNDNQQLDLIFDPGGALLLDQYRTIREEKMGINVEFTAWTYPFFGNNIKIDIWCLDLGVDLMQLGAGKVTELKFLVLGEESMSNPSYYFIIVGEILMRYFMFDVFSLIWDGVGSNNWCRWWLTLNIDVLVTMMFLRKHLQWFNVLVSNMHKNLYFLDEALENLYIISMGIILEVSVLNEVRKEVCPHGVLKSDLKDSRCFHWYWTGFALVFLESPRKFSLVNSIILKEFNHIIKATTCPATKQIDGKLARIHSYLWVFTPYGHAALECALVGHSLRSFDFGYSSDLYYVAAQRFSVFQIGVFWMLVVLLEHMLVCDSYTTNLGNCYTRKTVFEDLLINKCPRVVVNLKDLEFDASVTCIEWFLCKISTSLISETMLLVWDFPFSADAKQLVMVGLTIFKMNEVSCDTPFASGKIAFAIATNKSIFRKAKQGLVFIAELEQRRKPLLLPPSSFLGRYAECLDCVHLEQHLEGKVFLKGWGMIHSSPLSKSPMSQPKSC